MKNNIKQLLKLFVPIFIANIGVFTMSLVDSLMLAQNHTEHLALQSIGDMPITITLMLMNGLLQGTLYTSAEYFGKQKYQEAGATFRNSTKQALLLSLTAIILYFCIPYLLDAQNYNKNQIIAATKVMKILCCSIPFSLIYFSCMFFLNGVQKPWIATKFVIIANVLNFILNWLFIDGKFGFPPMYSAGVALSTTIVRIFLSFCLLSSILFHREFKKFNILYGKTSVPSKHQNRIGYYTTFNLISFEAGIAFCLYYASNINLLTAAAFTLSYRLMGFMHLISVSLAVATSVITSPLRTQIAKTKQLLSSAFQINNYIIIPICITAIILTSQLATSLSNDISLQSLLRLFLPFTFIAIIFRCINSMQIIILRSFYDLTIPSILYCISFILVQPGITLWQGKWQQGLGIIIAIVVANLLATISLAGRFLFLLKPQTNK